MSFAVSGVFAAAATPYNADLSPDHGLLVEHCLGLLADGCHGIALLGTTGEANSLSVGERMGLLEAMLKGGIAPEQLMPGTGVAAIPETVALTRHALDRGVVHVVMLPPFYYKGVSDEGLYAAYARIIEGVGDDRLRIVLYHIPQMSGMPLSQALVSRLHAAFPGTVVGIKDSSGDFANTEAYATSNPGFAVFAGPDPLLLPMLKSGGAGCITANANLVVGVAAHHLRRRRRSGPGVRGRGGAGADHRLSHPGHVAIAQIPAVKAMLALKTGNPGWNRVRPPLLPLTATQVVELREKLERHRLSAGVSRCACRSRG